MSDLRDITTGTEASGGDPFNNGQPLSPAPEYLHAGFVDDTACEEINDGQRALLNDDIGLKSSLTAGVASLVPDTAVGTFVTSAKTSVLSAGGAAAAAGGVAAVVGTARLSASSIIMIIMGAILAGALIVGGVALVTSGDDPANVNGTQDTDQPSYTSDYPLSDIRIIFTDPQGNDGDVNIVKAILIEEDSVAVQINWQIVMINEAGGSGDAFTVQSGSGTQIESAVFDNLDSGTYRVFFTLTDSVGAQAEISRTFTLN